MISETLRVIRASIDDGCVYAVIEDYDRFRVPKFEDIVDRDMIAAGDSLKATVRINATIGECWVAFLTTKVTN